MYEAQGSSVIVLAALSGLQKGGGGDSILVHSGARSGLQFGFHFGCIMVGRKKGCLAGDDLPSTRGRDAPLGGGALHQRSVRESRQASNNVCPHDCSRGRFGAGGGPEEDNVP